MAERWMTRERERERERERVKEILADGTLWWWWWSVDSDFHPQIKFSKVDTHTHNIYICVCVCVCVCVYWESYFTYLFLKRVSLILGNILFIQVKKNPYHLTPLTTFFPTFILIFHPHHFLSNSDMSATRIDRQPLSDQLSKNSPPSTLF